MGYLQESAFISPCDKGFNRAASHEDTKKREHWMMERQDNAGAPAWRISAQICAFSDGERHLGHIVKVGARWHAYDATHSNGTEDGFLCLGNFVSTESAKDAVEQSCGHGRRGSLKGAA